MRGRQVAAVLALGASLLAVGVWKAPVIVWKLTTAHTYGRSPGISIARYTVHRWLKNERGQPKFVQHYSWNEKTGRHGCRSGCYPWWGGERDRRGEVVERPPWELRGINADEWWDQLPDALKRKPRVITPTSS